MRSERQRRFGALELLSRNIILCEFGADLDLVRPDLVRTQLRAGQVLNEPGEEIRNVYFLEEGVVSKFAVFDTGQEVESVLAGRNAAIGAMATVGIPTALTRDVVVFDAQAWALSRKQLERAYRHSARITRAMECSFKDQMAYAIRIGACNAVHAIEQRLSRWLLSCSALIERHDIGLGQEVFAKVLGAQRSSINPILQRFQSEGFITLGRSRLTITDPEGLRRRACGCFAALDLNCAPREPG